MGERQLIVGVELDGAPKRHLGFVHRALGRECLAQVMPGAGVIGGQLGRSPQVRNRVVGV